MTTRILLSSCPYCHSGNVVFSEPSHCNITNTKVTCKNCGAQGPYGNPLFAAAKWNLLSTMVAALDDSDKS